MADMEVIRAAVFNAHNVDEASMARGERDCTAHGAEFRFMGNTSRGRLNLLAHNTAMTGECTKS